MAYWSFEDGQCEGNIATDFAGHGNTREPGWPCYVGTRQARSRSRK
jgi:hypothetical protein